jgi:hypothetical protein
MPVARAVLVVLSRNSGDEITYSWVQAELQSQTGSGIPARNLKRLATYGILQMSGDSRQSHRVYYRMPAPEEVDRVLRQLGFGN